MTETIEWIDRETRLPGADDADEYGCVLCKHRYNGILVTGWRRVAENSFIVAWAKTPGGPAYAG